LDTSKQRNQCFFQNQVQLDKKYFNLPHERVNKLAVLALQYQTFAIKLIAFVMQLVNITAEGKISVA
jgi:hypothetical protein